MIRWLYLTHRWVGVVLALFMLLWFSSGLIIAYTGSIVTTPEQRLAHSQFLSPDAFWLSLGEAIGISAEARANAQRLEPGHMRGMGHERGTFHAGEIVEGRLARVDSNPVWRIEDASGERFAVSALDGEIQSFSREEAKRIAERWFAAEAVPGRAPPTVSYSDTFDSSVILRNFQNYRPFHRFAADDGFGTEVIVSAKTGEVLEVASAWQRGLYYAGNFTHLFRPLDFLKAGELRRDTLFWAGLFAFVTALTGMVIGWLRWKPGFFGKPAYSKGRTQPYREFWLRYHFWAGLIGGTFSVLWAFSGALSTNPMQIFSEATASPKELARFRGPVWPTVISARTPDIAPDLAESAIELGWTHLGGHAQLLVYGRNGVRTAVESETLDIGLDKATLLSAAQQLAAQDAIAGDALLRDYDSYYYPNRRQGPLDRPLPVLRVDLADSGHTSLYIDPKSGQLISKFDTSRRIYRWLYTALHHWDFAWLRERSIWLPWMTVLIGFGLVLSLSSVVLGWRRLRRTIKVVVPVPERVPEVSDGQEVTA